MPVAAERLLLSKWYLDCVDADGRVAIGYWASLQVYGLSLTWHSVAAYTPGRPPLERTSLCQVPAPERQDDSITWSSAALDCAFTLQAPLPAASLRLLDDPRGRIDWHCEAPGGQCRVTTRDGAPLHGAGYAECLVMTALPWHLPIDELRWGRWISLDATRSVVWIDWQGDSPQRWVLVDGVQRTGAMVRDDGIGLGDTELTLRDRRTLHERSLRDVVGPIASLAPLLPASLLALHEHKWSSRGAWSEPAMPPVTGWAVHELVRFRR